MGTDNKIIGKLITLVPCTNEMWHEFYRKYVPDPLMDTTPYAYDYAKGEENFHKKMADATRKYFAILYEENVIGEVYLKHINAEDRSTRFGIALTDDSVKGKGLGTEAMQLIIGYAFHTLGFETIYAESVLRNTRSQYIMEKIGFVYTHEDDVFKYYKLERERTE